MFRDPNLSITTKLIQELELSPDSEGAKDILARQRDYLAGQAKRMKNIPLSKEVAERITEYEDHVKQINKVLPKDYEYVSKFITSSYEEDGKIICVMVAAQEVVLEPSTIELQREKNKLVVRIAEIQGELNRRGVK